MKPQPYLQERGKEIFNEILKHVKDKKLDENIDSYELSMLANAFDMHEQACEKMKEDGATQITANGYSQIRAEFTMWQKTADYITKHSDKFGLNPAAREKIKAFAKKEEKQDPIQSI